MNSITTTGSRPRHLIVQIAGKPPVFLCGVTVRGTIDHVALLPESATCRNCRAILDRQLTLPFRGPSKKRVAARVQAVRSEAATKALQSGS